MKKIAIIGSTGFIGTQALQVIEKYPDKFKVVALTANENADLLISQSRKFKPKYVGICSEHSYSTVKSACNCKVGCGEACLAEAASTDCDIVLVAVVGCIGLKAVLAAIESGHNVALANKESLVSGGELVIRSAREKGVSILPVDSEHSAIWQCLLSGERKDVKRLILTASGGPFYNTDSELLENVTPEQAINHPTWRMGKKISVDSATMMNKGLEIIEARWLFDTEKIDYVIHPQSIIHSMVEYNDGAVIAQLSLPDMRLPIQLAFTYPERLCGCVNPMPLTGNLSFLQPKEDVFVLPALAKESLRMGKNATCILNAANEAAVALFLGGKIKFTQISEIAVNALKTERLSAIDSAQDVFDTHNEIYEKLMMNYNRYGE